MTVFFDSEGRAWVTCKADHRHATAFGPTGAARPIDDMEAYDLGLRTDPRSTVTHFAAADAQRRVVRATAAHEWDWLPDGEPLLRLKERNRPFREWNPWGNNKPHYTPG
jgi:hypothetical protein